MLTFAALYPYIRAVISGQTRPHVFSWFIWGVGTLVVFAAQLLDGGGFGAMVIGVSGVITFGIAMLALSRGADRSIVAMDWVFLALAASALPLRFLTETALSAVIILTLVDLLGFGPSVRKAYDRPWEENATFFAIGAVRNVFVLLALANHSWTTVLFPAAVGIACFGFVCLILLRRQVKPQSHQTARLDDRA
ncbi:MAG: hypothetical protein AAGJ84_02405 [Pseudomonadota bacterium]